MTSYTLSRKFLPTGTAAFDPNSYHLYIASRAPHNNMLDTATIVAFSAVAAVAAAASAAVNKIRQAYLFVDC